MADVLTADDPLYDELYDVENEARELGNLVEGDMNAPMRALAGKGAVQEGFLRDLLGLPPHYRHAAAEGKQGYTCFDWETSEKAFRQNDIFSSAIYHHPLAGEHEMLGIIEMIGARHRGYRMTMQPMFIKPRTLTLWRERWIDDIITALCDRLATQEKAELNIQLCARVPVHTVTRAIGMDGDDALVFREALIKSTLVSTGDAAERNAYGQTVERMLYALIAERRRDPRDDLVSRLVQAEVNLPGGEARPLTDWEIMVNCRLVMVAGGGTSWRQFGITLWALLTNPEQMAAVRADRSLIDAAIEESLRWNPTDPVFSRLVTQDTELGGVALPGGSVLEICLGTANRDPSRWDNPDAYDLHRPAQHHLGFGMGAHQCLGRDVARAEINVGVNALLDRFPNLRLDPDAPAPYLTGGLEQRGMSALNVLLR